MGTVVRKLRHLTPRTSPRQVFSPTRKYVFYTYSLLIAYQLPVRTQRASGARIKRFLCAALPYVRRSATSACQFFAFPGSLLPLSGFVQQFAVLDKIGGWLRNQKTLKARQQQRRGSLDQPILRREVILKITLMADEE
jgi:hypothetical protein